MSELYEVKRTDEAGKVTFSRVGEAPESITIALELIQEANPGVVRIDREHLTILNDRYRITGWSAERGGLVCTLQEPLGPTE